MSLQQNVDVVVERNLNEIIQLAWARFKIIVGIIGDVQGRVIAVLFYFIVALPFGIGARLFSDPLHLRQRPPAWIDREPVDNRLEGAQRQG
ncbi:MAG: hypothetical protein HUU38_30760 [Anaerolineales bacterium]|nr:hypothetical protein [Anaerolineales bacterium]